MILSFNDGRLGNQIFQYLFIKSIQGKEQTIVSYNFEDILTLFDSIENVINVQNKYLKLLIRKAILPFLDYSARVKLISSYKIDTCNENGFIVPDVTFSMSNGLLPITYIYPCFAQSESFFKKSDVKHLIFKKPIVEKADEFLALIPNNYNKVFVHIRRCDYLHFSVLGKVGATLPLTYYKNGIKWFEYNLENPFFIFLTDDPEFVEHCFENMPNKLISKNSQFVDFSIMTLCEYGIMSNSSFSWWAAYMMKSRKKVFSPKYWLGWKSEIEWPKGIKPSFSEDI